jgi:hypothetical protein
MIVNSVTLISMVAFYIITAQVNSIKVPPLSWRIGKGMEEF